MKRLLFMILLSVLLCGCGNDSDQIGDALALRQQLLNGKGCTFTAEITADYGNCLYQFTVGCQGDQQGNLQFSVMRPESISGISGKITELGGTLTFDQTALAFEPIADGQLTPVTAPWIFLKTLRSGYIASCAVEDTLTHLQIDDSYSEKALHLDIWLDENNIPVRAEILWEGRRILSLIIADFTLL